MVRFDVDRVNIRDERFTFNSLGYVITHDYIITSNNTFTFVQLKDRRKGKTLKNDKMIPENFLPSKVSPP